MCMEAGMVLAKRKSIKLATIAVLVMVAMQ